MKSSLAIIAVFLYLHVFSQAELPKTDSNTDKRSTVVNTTAFTAYIDGKPINESAATYAAFNVRLNKEVIFDYGQQADKRKDLVLTDEKGVPLVFSNLNTAFLLNFFFYNNWEPAFPPTSSLQSDWILKKRKK